MRYVTLTREEHAAMKAAGWVFRIATLYQLTPGSGVYDPDRVIYLFGPPGHKYTASRSRI